MSFSSSIPSTINIPPPIFTSFENVMSSKYDFIKNYIGDYTLYSYDNRKIPKNEQLLNDNYFFMDKHSNILNNNGTGIKDKDTQIRFHQIFMSIMYYYENNVVSIDRLSYPEKVLIIETITMFFSDLNTSENWIEGIDIEIQDDKEYVLLAYQNKPGYTCPHMYDYKTINKRLTDKLKPSHNTLSIKNLLISYLNHVRVSGDRLGKNDVKQQQRSDRAKQIMDECSKKDQNENVCYDNLYSLLQQLKDDSYGDLIYKINTVLPSPFQYNTLTKQTELTNHLNNYTGTVLQSINRLEKTIDETTSNEKLLDINQRIDKLLQHIEDETRQINHASERVSKAIQSFGSKHGMRSGGRKTKK